MELKLSPQLHGRKGAAEKLGVSLRTLDDLIATKQLISLKIRKRRLISEEAIASFIRKAERISR